MADGSGITVGEVYQFQPYNFRLLAHRAELYTEAGRLCRVLRQIPQAIWQQEEPSYHIQFLHRTAVAPVYAGAGELTEVEG